jgi:hypothetical protein
MYIKGEGEGQLAATTTDICPDVAMFEARTIASRLLFGVASVAGPNANIASASQLRRISVSMSISGCNPMWYSKKLFDAARNDYALSFLPSVRLSGLSALHLGINMTIDWYHDAPNEVFVQLGKVLERSKRLTELSLCFAYMDEESFESGALLKTLTPLWQMCVPSLQKLSVKGARLQESVFADFLHAHKNTLIDLTIEESLIVTNMGRWETLLKRLPHLLSLTRLNVSWLMDVGDDNHGINSFIGPHASSLPHLQEYVCHGGLWIPLQDIYIHDERAMADENTVNWDWS